jgi:hypothetical protein
MRRSKASYTSRSMPHILVAQDRIHSNLRGRGLDWQDGDVILLENTRFYKMEEKNDKDFSKQLAAPYDMSVTLSRFVSLSSVSVLLSFSLSLSLSLSFVRARAAPYGMSVLELKLVIKEFYRFPFYS